VTVLVNNVGITRDHLLFKMTGKDWDSVLSVHLRGSLLMCRGRFKIDDLDGFWREMSRG